MSVQDRWSAYRYQIDIRPRPHGLGLLVRYESSIILFVLIC
jgi:hypothetical protein